MGGRIEVVKPQTEREHKIARMMNILNDENNRLFFGVVKALEYLKGFERASYTDTVEFLTQTLEMYGVRREGEEAERMRGFRLETTALAKERQHLHRLPLAQRVMDLQEDLVRLFVEEPPNFNETISNNGLRGYVNRAYTTRELTDRLAVKLVGYAKPIDIVGRVLRMYPQLFECRFYRNRNGGGRYNGKTSYWRLKRNAKSREVMKRIGLLKEEASTNGTGCGNPQGHRGTAGFDRAAGNGIGRCPAHDDRRREEAEGGEVWPSR